MGWPDDGMLFAMFHSAMIGAVNMSQLRDEKMDELLAALLGPKTMEENLKAVEAVERYSTEMAYTIPLYAPKTISALSNTVKGATWQAQQGVPWLFDAWIQD
jgi:ABC-type transport system substrate-binding protein